MALSNDQIMAKNFKEFYERIRPSLNTSGTMGFTPVGTYITVIGRTAPINYLICDGTIYNIAAYPELAAYFKEQFNAENYFGGDGTMTFAVPNIQPSHADTVYCIAYKNLFIDNFEASNLYSITERVVGRWIDGKPLYQKVITNISVLQGVNVWLKCYSLGTTCKIVRGAGYIGKNNYFSPDAEVSWAYNFNGTTDTEVLGDVSYATSLSNYYSDSYKITLILQYIKTTD